MDAVQQRLMELLPEGIRRAFFGLEKPIIERAEELRLRMAFPATVLLPEGEMSLGNCIVSEREIAHVMDRASRSSLHSVQRELRQGYISAGVGLRLGVCGSFAGGGMEGIRNISSLALRIAHEKRGVGKEAIEVLRPFDSSVLIVSSPGGGKTTFLRELIRSASNSGKRVCLCDERREVAAQWQGRLSFDLGKCTDVLSGMEKAEGIMMLLRAMNPEIIALDEISAAADAAAMEQAAYCGAAIFATVHGKNLQELKKRRLFNALLETGIFEKAVIISGREKRCYEVVDI